MPESDIKRRIVPIVTPIAKATGLDQRWGMFSPNPPQRLENLEVHVTMADGGGRVWTFQRGEPLIGQFSWYHWQKMKENAVRRQELRIELAHWAVRELTDPSERAVRVEVILHTEPIPAPGTNDPRTPGVKTLYSEELTGR
jgi:hypothetical protein